MTMDIYNEDMIEVGSLGEVICPECNGVAEIHANTIGKNPKGERVYLGTFIHCKCGYIK